MKKFIVAIDGLQYSQAAVLYAVRFTKENKAHLTGVFLNDITYHSYKIYELITDEGVSGPRQKELEEKDERTRAEAKLRFEKTCQEAGIEYTVHKDRNIAIQELLHESIYADLLIIDKNETFTHYNENPPTRFIRELLEQVQCPVMIVPSEYTAINKIMLLYDGEPSSVYAIKMIDYTIEAAKKYAAEVLSVTDFEDSLHLPDNRLMKEFMKRHFPNAVYKVSKGLPEVEILKSLATEPPGTMIVLGAYQRGMISRWFRQSMADLLLKQLQLPLFIAHNK
jgi:nucleotide-binding universal stress UspA family protein